MIPQCHSWVRIQRKREQGLITAAFFTTAKAWEHHGGGKKIRLCTKTGYTYMRLRAHTHTHWNITQPLGRRTFCHFLQHGWTVRVLCYRSKPERERQYCVVSLICKIEENIAVTQTQWWSGSRAGEQEKREHDETFRTDEEVLTQQHRGCMLHAWHLASLRVPASALQSKGQSAR